MARLFLLFILLLTLLPFLLLLLLSVTVYLSGLDWAEELWKVEELVAALEGAPEVVTEVKSWYKGYKASLPRGLSTTNLTREQFHTTLGQYLYR